MSDDDGVQAYDRTRRSIVHGLCSGYDCAIELTPRHACYSHMGRMCVYRLCGCCRVPLVRCTCNCDVTANDDGADDMCLNTSCAITNSSYQLMPLSADPCPNVTVHTSAQSLVIVHVRSCGCTIVTADR